jgi:hypothetical protein
MSPRWSALALAVALGGCSALVPCSNAGIAPFEAGAGQDVARGAKYAGWLAGAPLDLAALPVAALAWASPWGDLALFADVLTAPSIATGYALEAVVGGPVAGIAALADDDPMPAAHERWTPAADALVPWGFVVEHRPAAAPARATRRLPDEVAARYDVPESAVAVIVSSLTNEPVSVRLDGLGFAGALEITWAGEGEARPLVLLTPPSQATFAARYLARRFARRGAHAAVLVPDGDYLTPGLEPVALEGKLRAGLVAARAVVRACARSPRVARVAYLGVSAGGIFGSMLLAVEPLVDRAALVFPGGDLPRLVEASTEDTVRDYRESFLTRGVGLAELRGQLAAAIETDPLRLAAAVDPRRVLLFLADSDTMVPLVCGLELREALGEPETWLLSGEHEVAGCCFGFVLRQADEFLLGD